MNIPYVNTYREQSGPIIASQGPITQLGNYGEHLVEDSHITRVDTNHLHVIGRTQHLAAASVSTTISRPQRLGVFSRIGSVLRRRPKQQDLRAEPPNLQNVQQFGPPFTAQNSQENMGRTSIHPMHEPNQAPLVYQGGYIPNTTVNGSTIPDVLTPTNRIQVPFPYPTQPEIGIDFLYVFWSMRLIPSQHQITLNNIFRRERLQSYTPGRGN